jgi:Fic family protein
MQMDAKAATMAERDEESGRYSETYPLSGFIEALESLGGSAGTQDVADAVGCKYRTANAKLHELEEEGRVSARKVGNAYLWSLKVDSE